MPKIIKPKEVGIVTYIEDGEILHIRSVPVDMFEKMVKIMDACDYSPYKPDMKQLRGILDTVPESEWHISLDLRGDMSGWGGSLYRARMVLHIGSF